MEAGDTLSVYAELYGWYYYDIIWDVLASTGVAGIPVVAVVIGHIISARERASMWGHSTDSLLAGLETKLVVLLGVLILAAIPNPFTTVGPASYSHLERASIYNEATEVRRVGDTGTTLDTAAVDPRLGGTATAVPVPPFWLLVTAISHGVTHAVQSQVDQRGRALEGIKRALEIAKVRNVDVRARLQQFYNECFAPARERYARALAFREDAVLNAGGGGGADIPDRLDGFEGVDVGRLNSSYFIENGAFYASIRTRSPVPGFDYDPEVDVQYTIAPPNGHPTCLQFYNQLVGQMQADSNYGFVAGTILSGARYIPGLDEVADDWILDKYFADAATGYQSQADVAVSRRNAERGAFVQAASDAWGTYQLGKLAISADIFADAVIYALHQLRSVAMIVVLMALPIGLVMSGYSVGYLIQASFVVFTVIFISAIWAIASWAETALTQSLYPSLFELKSFLSSDVADALADAKKRMALSSAVVMFYTVLPLAFTWVMMAAGASAGGAVSRGFGDSGGTRKGGAAGISMSGAARGARGAVNSLRR